MSQFNSANRLKKQTINHNNYNNYVKKSIKGIKYLLNEENLTAEVIQKKGYEGDIIIPETVVLKEVAYRVTSIGEEAFRYCESLTSIVIPESVTSIGSSAFKGCSSLTSIVIGNGVTSIGYGAFLECKSLTSIVIPESVTNIGYSAFKGCKSLTSITFQGTIAQWNEIDFGNSWNDEVPINAVHCTDGDVEI